MQKFYFLLLLFVGVNLTLCAQNGIVGTGFSTGWNVPADNTSFSESAGGSRILITPANGTGNQFFRLVRNAGDSEFYQNGQFGPVGCSADADLTTTNGSINATDGCGTVAFFITVDDVNHNYVFKTRGLFEDPVDFIYFKVEGVVKEMDAALTAQVPAPDANGFVATDETVTVGSLVNGGFSVGQAAYLRYTTDGFATSTVIPMVDFAGGLISADIPPQPDGTTVTYYLFTSGDAVAPAADGSDADYRTINLENNGGSNYTYTVNRALPVTYAGWSGQRVKADAVRLDWATATEDQAAYFALECSQDGGRQWMERAQITATNAPTGSTYSFLDEGTPTGDLQYRLRQVDFDGRFEYSTVISVAGEAAGIETWPQPAGDELFLLIPSTLQTGTLRIVDLNGRIKTTLPVAEGRQRIDLSGYAPGIYLIQGEGIETKRIIVR